MTTNDDRTTSTAPTVARATGATPSTPSHPPSHSPPVGMGALFVLVAGLATFSVGGAVGWAMAQQSDRAAVATAIDAAFAAAPTDQVAAGRFDASVGVLEAGAERGYDAVDGIAIAISADDREGTVLTDLVVAMSGLRADTDYPGHLHEAPCSADGGGHYKHDPDGATVPPNEVHFTLGAGPDGAAIAHGSEADWWLEPGARSVVVHDPDDGAKLLCIDLSFLDPSAI